MNGLFLFDKPSGVSSAGFLNEVKKFFVNEKTGHGGTLDPFATGLLIVGVGREYTKQLHSLLTETTKTYIADIVIGASSSTDDRDGVITQLMMNKISDENEIRKAVSELCKKEEQFPPIVSAIKKDGVPAYLRARRGEDVQQKSRNVKVINYDIKKIEIFDDKINIQIELEVSAGFYIRSFARDLGEALGSGGYVQELRRIKIGEYGVDRALAIKDLGGIIEVSFEASGAVVGVGYRLYASKIAQNWPINGFARNIGPSLIEVVGQGKLVDLEEFIGQVRRGPETAKIEKQFVCYRKCREMLEGFKVL